MKLVVVGTSHYGYEATQTLLKDYPQAEIHLYERGDTASFLSCGIHSFLKDISPSLDSLHYANEESYKEQGINIHVNSDVIGLDPENKTITVKTRDGESEQSYDKLFLSPGGLPAEIDVPGTDLENVLYMRGRDWAYEVKEHMSTSKKAVVIGAGYIGVEAAEAYQRAGIDTTLIDFADHMVHTYLDEDLAKELEAAAKEAGLDFHGGEAVKELVGEDGKVTKVVTDKQEYDCDTVIIAVGVKPDTDWLKGKIEVDDAGFVVLDEYSQTSDENIFAGGDATKIVQKSTGKEANIALATNARKQAVISAKNCEEKKYKVPAVNGTSSLTLFGLTFSSTGLNHSNVEAYDGEVESKFVHDLARPSFIDSEDLYMKVYYDADSHVVLGAQFLSEFDSVAEGANIVSLAISHEVTLEDLALQDFYFQPEHDRPWHYVNVLAQQALGETFGSDLMIF